MKREYLTNYEIQERIKRESDPANLPDGGNIIFAAIGGPKTLAQIGVEAMDDLEKMQSFLTSLEYEKERETLDEYFKTQGQMLEQLDMVVSKLNLIKSLFAYKNEAYKSYVRTHKEN